MPGPLPGTARWDRADIDAAIEALKRLGKPAVLGSPLPLEKVDPLGAWIAQRREKKNAGL